MIESLIAILIVALILFIIWWAVSKFLPGTVSQIIGIILGLILLLYALNRLGMLGGLRL